VPTVALPRPRPQLRRPRVPALPDGLARRLAAPGAIVGLTLIAAYVRGTTAVRAPLWIDEGISIGIARHPLSQIPHLLREDGSPPVYYVLLHWWMALFGSSPASTHALSIGFSVLAVPACAWAAWKPFGARAAVIAAGLATFVPLLGEYADETRMYSLAFLLAALATGAFLRAFVLGSRVWAIGFGVLVALLCLTHGWGLFYGAGAACAVVVALASGPGRLRLAVNALIAAVVAGVLFAPWVPTLLFQAAHTGAPWSHMPTPKSLQRAGSRMLGSRAPETLLLVVAGGGLLVAARHVRRVALGLVCVTAIALVTLAAGYLASRLDQPVWALRYLTVPLAPLVIAVGAGLDRAGTTGVVAALVVCALFWVGKPSAPALSDKSNVYELSAAMAGELPKGTLIASPQPEQVPVLRQYLGPGLRYVTPFGMQHDDGVVDWVNAEHRLTHSTVRRTLARAVRRLKPGQRVLLVAPLFGRPDSPWTKSVAHRARHWKRWLHLDRHLIQIGSYVPGKYASRATVAGVLYVRRAPRRSHV
jgi:mannosyltransferase